MPVYGADISVAGAVSAGGTESGVHLLLWEGTASAGGGCVAELMFPGH